MSDMKNGVFTVAGSKGGVGKTTTTINLAATLAGGGSDVIVIELDLAMANIVDFVDLETELTAKPTLHDVLADDTAVFDAIREAPGGFDLLPSGVELDGFADVDVTRLEWVLDALESPYDVILLDTGAGVSEETVFPLSVADGVILVSTPRAAAVRDTKKTKRLATDAGTDVVGVVFTRSGTGTSPPPARLAEFLDVEFLGHVPRDDAVPRAQDAGEPVPRHAPESDAAHAYHEVATTAFDLPTQPAGTGHSDDGAAADADSHSPQAQSSGPVDATNSEAPEATIGSVLETPLSRSDARTDGLGSDESEPATPVQAAIDHQAQSLQSRTGADTAATGTTERGTEYSAETDQDDSATESDQDATTEQSETGKDDEQQTSSEQGDAEHAAANADPADESESDQHGQQSLASRAKRFVTTRLGSE
ncbi:P-loop NTPase [Halorientalis marina]|uniref:P-loop NTPase n=1 Tax=Halorientalis marina TaxID=2931976 RepID=UPI001FF40C79|nr:P-loop NTPase [Halorientalis marina]